ncbi:MAG: hypothetical protein ACYS0F_08125, partial [Planctomycetota bacterium]
MARGNRLLTIACCALLAGACTKDTFRFHGASGEGLYGIPYDGRRRGAGKFQDEVARSATSERQVPNVYTRGMVDAVVAFRAGATP